MPPPLRPDRFIPTYVGHTEKFVVLIVQTSVHPHIRGAYSARVQEMMQTPGSSPHTWGIRGFFGGGSTDRRFIPTYVGHTQSDCAGGQKSPVHPHIRGAYAANVEDGGTCNGSSPHTWGIRTEDNFVDEIARFIPTYVGHTPAQRLPRQRPRGSSPHTWGIQRRIAESLAVARFIPTYVGHTLGFFHFYLLHSGSSPHTWGIRPAQMGGQCARGFIPTYVGHTDCRAIKGNHSSVHPHIRGAYITNSLIMMDDSGSSPHTWGIHSAVIQGGQRNTVHPHIRGAYVIGPATNRPEHGSSPHTWGILRIAAPIRTPTRFIPTYVGHTWRRNRLRNGTRFIPTYVGHTLSPCWANRKPCGSSPHTWGIRKGIGFRGD